MKVDLPALGRPSMPTSASSSSSSFRVRSPGVPLLFWRGARLTELLKRVLPRPWKPPWQPAASLVVRSQQFAGIFIGRTGTDRHAQDLVLAATTGTVGALAILATLGGVETLETVVDQGVQVFIGNQIHVATVTAVTAVRAAVRNVFLPAKAHTTVTTVTGIDSNLDFINKLQVTVTLIRKTDTPL